MPAVESARVIQTNHLSGCEKMKIAIVASEFNKEITDKMLEAALAEAAKENFSVLAVVAVPGALEAPLAVKKLLKKKEIEGVAVLGAVIQGKTEHDRLVAFTAADKLLGLSLEFEKPVAVCISGPRITQELASLRAEGYGKRSIQTLKNMQKSLKTIR